MKVRELIQKLLNYNQDADISTSFSEDITLGFIFTNNDGDEFTEKTTPYVFIEPADSCPDCIHLHYECGEGMCSFYDKPCKEVTECYQFESNDEYD